MNEIEKILGLLKEKGISQKELAEEIGFKESNISDWKKGKSRSYKKYLYQIADFLGVPVDVIRDDSTKSKNNFKSVKIEVKNMMDISTEMQEKIKNFVNRIVKQWTNKFNSNSLSEEEIIKNALNSNSLCTLTYGKIKDFKDGNAYPTYEEFKQLKFWIDSVIVLPNLYVEIEEYLRDIKFATKEELSNINAKLDRIENSLKEERELNAHESKLNGLILNVLSSDEGKEKIKEAIVSGQ